MSDRHTTRVWEWPLRVWHWALVVCIAGSLYSGLAGDIALFDWHARSGYAIVGLLVFRLLWAAWGGRYTRFRSYWTTPGRILQHFKGAGAANQAHTAPGVGLVVGLFVLVGVQVTTGLFATDDIFNEGPLNRFVGSDTASAMTALHHRIFWGIIVLIAVHVGAHLVYAVWLKDPNWRSMFTGRKAVALADTPSYSARALLTAGAVGGAVYLTFTML